MLTAPSIIAYTVLTAQPGVLEGLESMPSTGSLSLPCLQMWTHRGGDLFRKRLGQVIAWFGDLCMCWIAQKQK